MTYRIIILFLLLTAASWSQEQRIALAGSRISIVPPAHTEVLNHSSTIVGADYKMTLIEIPTAEGLAKFETVDSTNYSNSGVVVHEQINCVIDGYKAKMIYLNSEKGFSFVQFILVSDEFHVIGSAQLELGDKLVYQNIVTSFQSIEIDEEKSILWDEFFAFNLTTESKFQLDEEGCSPMQVVFTKNEVTVGSSASNKRSFIICKQEPRIETVSLLDQFISNSITPLLGKELHIRKVITDEKTTKDGVEIYEFIADCELNGISFQLHCVATLLDEVSVFLYGQSYNPEDHTEIDQFMAGLTFKK